MYNTHSIDLYTSKSHQLCSVQNKIKLTKSKIPEMKITEDGNHSTNPINGDLTQDLNEISITVIYYWQSVAGDKILL